MGSLQKCVVKRDVISSVTREMWMSLNTTDDLRDLCYMKCHNFEMKLRRCDPDDGQSLQRRPLNYSLLQFQFMDCVRAVWWCPALTWQHFNAIYVWIGLAMGDLYFIPFYHLPRAILKLKWWKCEAMETATGYSDVIRVKTIINIRSSQFDQNNCNLS